MPIRPENRHRYPSNWKLVRQRILARAANQCEWPGCEARHRELGYWMKGTWIALPRTMREAEKIGTTLVAWAVLYAAYTLIGANLNPFEWPVWLRCMAAFFVVVVSRYTLT